MISEAPAASEIIKEDLKDMKQNLQESGEVLGMQLNNRWETEASNGISSSQFSYALNKYLVHIENVSSFTAVALKFLRKT